MSPRFIFWKPGAVTWTSYTPGSRKGITYLPSLLDLASAERLLALLTALTIALGIAEPEGSVTLPPSVARNSCGHAQTASATRLIVLRINELRMSICSPLQAVTNDSE